jgi:hypothetical protein
MRNFHANCICFADFEKTRTVDRQGFTLRITDNAIIANKYGIDLEVIALLPGISLDCELVARAIAKAEQVLFSLFNTF